MQTFLPYSNFKVSASILDFKRLGKQRVEAKQILNAIENNTGWRNHPIVRMWRNYTTALKLYHNTMIIEWIKRGYNNMPLLHFKEKDLVMPEWLGRQEFHSAHRAALLYKDFEFYSKYNWGEEAKIEYIWY